MNMQGVESLECWNVMYNKCKMNMGCVAERSRNTLAPGHKTNRFDKKEFEMMSQDDDVEGEAVAVNAYAGDGTDACDRVAHWNS